jgi:hypothetical protein
MRIKCQLLAISILCLMPLASLAQDVVTQAKSTVKVDWIKGTDFSKFKTYAWGTSHQMTPGTTHPTEDIDAGLQAKGLQKVARDANPDLLVAFNAGTKPAYLIKGFFAYTTINQGTLIVELADPQSKTALWWGIADDAMTGNHDKDLPVIQKKLSKMFEKYPPPAKK